MTQLKGTNVLAPVVPFDTADPYPSHVAAYGKGGYRSVANLAERDGIPSLRREAGMVVFVTSLQKEYRLEIDLTTWTEVVTSIDAQVLDGGNF
jgi:predicted transcriptional regulator